MINSKAEPLGRLPESDTTELKAEERPSSIV